MCHILQVLIFKKTLNFRANTYPSAAILSIIIHESIQTCDSVREPYLWVEANLYNIIIASFVADDGGCGGQCRRFGLWSWAMHCLFGFGYWLIYFKVIWFKLSVRGYYSKKFYYINNSTDLVQNLKLYLLKLGKAIKLCDLITFTVITLLNHYVLIVFLDFNKSRSMNWTLSYN